MKIYGLDPNINKQQGINANKPSGVDFQELLRNQLQQTTLAESTSAIQGAGTTTDSSPQLRVHGLALTEASLNTLEEYSAALANPTLSGEALEPFIGTLEEETSAMLAVRDQLGEEDPLAGLLDRVAALTYLETAKYQRGDYTG